MLSLLLSLLLALPAQVAPPKVIDAVPNAGDLGVDARVQELRLTFDQDMSPRGYSLCGGGPEFPALMGGVRWESPRTVVIPVRLVAGRRYTFSVNCPAALNFRSARGVPAEVYPIGFRTLAPGEAAPTLTAEQSAEAVRTLRELIRDRYSHADRLGLDWDKLFEAHGNAMREATTPGALARAAAALLREAQDLHVGVLARDVQVPVFVAAVLANAEPGLVTKALRDLKTPSPRLTIGTLEGGVGYVAIHTWAGESAAALMEPAYDAIARFADAPGLMIDVRLNGGGDESVARAFASRFVEEPFVYAKSRVRDPAAPDGWAGPFERTVEPAQGVPVFRGPVAVLIGPACMSSNESFIKMIRRPGVRETFGGTTRGSSGFAKPHEIAPGVTVLLPSWVDMDASGRPLEGAGLTPDHRVEWPRGKPDRDPVLEAALAWLNAQKR